MLVLNVVAAMLILPAPVESRPRRGFFGTYHSTNGLVPGSNESVWDALEFGHTATYNSPVDGGFDLKDDIEFQCHGGGGVNAILGLTVAHTEGGVLNNPNDTALWSPAKPPGLVQAAWRWSQLSRLACPQIAGIVVDDFVTNYGGAGSANGTCASCPSAAPNGYGSKSSGYFCCPHNTSGGHCPGGGECCLVPGGSEGCQHVARCGVNPDNHPACNPSGLSLADIREIKGALHGHAVDARTGKVDFSSPALTPELKLFVVWYTTQTVGFTDDGLMAGGLVDGISLWLPGPDQDTHHANYTQHVRELRRRATTDWGRPPASLPILGGGYLVYSSLGYLPPAAFRSIWEQSVALYDAGELAGFYLFAASAVPGMNASEWREWDLPGLLGETYRPWLGTVCVTVTSSASSAGSLGSAGGGSAGDSPVVGATVVAEFMFGQGASERTFVARKLTGPDGRVCIDGWAGKVQLRPHALTVSRDGFSKQTVVAQLPRAAAANFTVVLVPVAAN
jgi:hypothetical protein